MTPEERSRKIEELYRAALELEPDRRSPYLRDTCADDVVLRSEVESRLADDSHAERQAEKSADEVTTRVVVINQGRSLLAGQPLGTYEIISMIGAGGMGEVYDALDTKLGREVAIKVLPPAFLDDPARLERFQREARMLAALNHPNIAVIHGLERSGDTHFLVMELVKGETLAERIARDGVLPLKKALDIGQQIAEALEAAHEKRIIHRDLKPANVKITPEGIVKILDFGLAKVFDVEDTAIRSPTPMATAMATGTGVIVGTPAYMSPEQARGKTVDKRTDIWAFGCVLYELLTARSAFGRETPSDTIVALLQGDPDWQALPRSTPIRLRELLQRCLQKDPWERLRDVGDARIELERLRREGSAATTIEGTEGIRRPAFYQRFGWVASIILAFAVIVLAYQSMRVVRPSDQTLRSDILPPDGTTFGSLAVSPDGRQLAFVASQNGKKQLWVRTVATAAQRPLAGTDGATYPFWSADSLNIGFFADGKLKRIPASGGSALILADAPLGRGGTWNENGVIIFSPGSNAPLSRVSSGGGRSEPITRLDVSDQEVSHRWPSFLPGGNRFLYFALSAQPGVNGPGNQGMLTAASLDGTVRKRLLVSAYGAAYASGYIVFARGAALLARRFRPETLTFEGQDLSTASDDIELGPVLDGPPFSVSESGEVLVYRRRGEPPSGQRELQWFARDGKSIGTLGSPDRYWSATMSQDGRFVAAEIEDPDTRANNIWIYDTEKSTRTRFTFGQTPDANPVWSPDGQSLLFGSRAQGQHFSLFMKASSGSDREQPLLQTQSDIYPEDLSRDKRFLLYTQVDPSEKSGASIRVLPLQGNGKPYLLVRSTADDRYAHFSPNGRWVAYRSNESGRNQIYVIRFGDAGGKWQISSNGGDRPVWRKDGQELYFLSADSELMAVGVRGEEPRFTFTPPEVLFKVDVLGGYGERFAASPDGRRFLALVNKDQAPRPLSAVVHWAAQLK